MDGPEEAWRWVPVPAGRTVSFIGEAAGSLQIEYAVASICRFLCIPWARGMGSDGGIQPTLEQNGEEGCTCETHLRSWHTHFF